MLQDDGYDEGNILSHSLCLAPLKRLLFCSHLSGRLDVRLLRTHALTTSPRLIMNKLVLLLMM